MRRPIRVANALLLTEDGVLLVRERPHIWILPGKVIERGNSLGAFYEKVNSDLPGTQFGRLSHYGRFSCEKLWSGTEIVSETYIGDLSRVGEANGAILEARIFGYNSLPDEVTDLTREALSGFLRDPNKDIYLRRFRTG